VTRSKTGGSIVMVTAAAGYLLRRIVCSGGAAIRGCGTFGPMAAQLL